MDPLDAFPGHLRRIAEAAQRWTPRLLSILPRVRDGRKVVQVEMDAASTAVYGRLIGVMEDFCRREEIPPDYSFGMRLPPPGVPPPALAQGELPDVWPSAGS